MFPRGSHVGTLSMGARVGTCGGFWGCSVFQAKLKNRHALLTSRGPQECKEVFLCQQIAKRLAGKLLFGCETMLKNMEACPLVLAGDEIFVQIIEDNGLFVEQFSHGKQTCNVWAFIACGVVLSYCASLCRCVAEKIARKERTCSTQAGHTWTGCSTWSPLTENFVFNSRLNGLRGRG